MDGGNTSNKNTQCYKHGPNDRAVRKERGRTIREVGGEILWGRLGGGRKKVEKSFFFKV